MSHSEEFVKLTFRSDHIPESKIEFPEEELKTDEVKQKSKEDYRQG